MIWLMNTMHSDLIRIKAVLHHLVAPAWNIAQVVRAAHISLVHQVAQVVQA